jgi:hypothetical protein
MVIQLLQGWDDLAHDVNKFSSIISAKDNTVVIADTLSLNEWE